MINTWIGGIVGDAAVGEKVVVHMMEGSASGIAWLYVWQDGVDVYRCAKKPNGAEALITTVAAERIRVSGSLLKGSNRVTEALRKKMEDLEIL